MSDVIRQTQSNYVAPNKKIPPQQSANSSLGAATIMLIVLGIVMFLGLVAFFADVSDQVWNYLFPTETEFDHIQH